MRVTCTEALIFTTDQWKYSEDAKKSIYVTPCLGNLSMALHEGFEEGKISVENVSRAEGVLLIGISHLVLVRALYTS